MIVTEKQLDETDKKILEKAAKAMTAKEIAYELNMSKRSVEGKIAVMKQWYQCKNMTDLVLKVGLQIQQ